MIQRIATGDEMVEDVREFRVGISPSGALDVTARLNGGEWCDVLDICEDGSGHAYRGAKRAGLKVNKAGRIFYNLCDVPAKEEAPAPAPPPKTEATAKFWAQGGLWYWQLDWRHACEFANPQYGDESMSIKSQEGMLVKANAHRWCSRVAQSHNLAVEGWETPHAT